MDYCIRHDILADVLTKNRGDIRMSILTEFDQKLHDKSLREEGFDEGINITIQIMDAIQDGYDTIEKLEAAGFDKELSKNILKRMNK